MKLSLSTASGSSGASHARPNATASPSNSNEAVEVRATTTSNYLFVKVTFTGAAFPRFDQSFKLPKTPGRDFGRQGAQSYSFNPKYPGTITARINGGFREDEYDQFTCQILRIRPGQPDETIKSVGQAIRYKSDSLTCEWRYTPPG